MLSNGLIEYFGDLPDPRVRDRTDYPSKSIDHLGLVSALCQELGIVEFIDNQFPNQSEHRHISYGQLLVAMILNGLGFVSRTLHLFPDYFADKPVERLLGAGIKPEHINDDDLLTHALCRS